MEALVHGEICYAEGSYYSPGAPRNEKPVSPKLVEKTPISVERKLTKLFSGIKERTMNTAVRVPVARPLPDASFVMPMRETYLQYANAPRAAALPAFQASPPPAPTPPETALRKKTLVGMAPEHIVRMPSEEFRACFAATSLRALTREQLALIDASKELSAIANAVLDQKAARKRGEAAQSAPQIKTLVGMSAEQIKALPPEELRARIAATPLRELTVGQLEFIDVEKHFSKTTKTVLDRIINKKSDGTRMALPKKLEAFIAQQVKAGFYRDASELVSESLRLLQKQTDITLLRLSLQREIESGIRNFQEGGFKPDEELLERFRQERSAHS